MSGNSLLCGSMRNAGGEKAQKDAPFLWISETGMDFACKYHGKTISFMKGSMYYGIDDRRAVH